jgi:plasmid stabilization system protein ParE
MQMQDNVCTEREQEYLLQRNFQYIVTNRPNARQRLDKYVPAETDSLVNSPLLGKAYNNTRQRIRRQQSDNFRCYATRCKYNNTVRGVLYVIRIYPLLSNGCVFYGFASLLYK